MKRKFYTSNLEFLCKAYYSLFAFTPRAILFVFILVCLIAFIAGVMPALRASRLTPIDALRYE